MAKKINITAQLNAATTDGILADAGQIFDAKKGKFQERVNEEFEARLVVADGEDLVTDGNVLRLKDRPNTDGMGYVILRKDKTFQEQVTKPNTIYEIRYDFDLGRQEKTVVLDTPFVLTSTGGAYYRTGDHIDVEAGMTVDLPSGGVLFDSTLSAIIPAPYTPSSKKSLYVGKLQSEAALGHACVYSLEKEVVIPENCVMKFEGGSLGNGTVVGNKSLISNEKNYRIFYNLEIIGLWVNNESYSNWFDLQYDNTTILMSLQQISNNVIITDDITTVGGKATKFAKYKGEEDADLIVLKNHNLIGDSVHAIKYGKIIVHENVNILRCKFDGGWNCRYVALSGDNITIRDTHFINIKSAGEGLNSVGLYVGSWYNFDDGYKWKNIAIDNCVFEGLEPYNEMSEVVTGRVCRAIHIYAAQDCKISNNTFKGMNGFSDSDYIHVQLKSKEDSRYPFDGTIVLDYPTKDLARWGRYEDGNIIISNNIFYQKNNKSSIKCMASNVSIINNKIILDVNNTDTAWGCIRCYNSENCLISNNDIHIRRGNYKTVFEVYHCLGLIVSGNNIICDDAKIRELLNSVNNGNCSFVNNNIIGKNIRTLIMSTYSNLDFCNNTVDIYNEQVGEDDVSYILLGYGDLGTYKFPVLENTATINFCNNKVSYTLSEGKLEWSPIYTESCYINNNYFTCNKYINILAVEELSIYHEDTNFEYNNNMSDCIVYISGKTYSTIQLKNISISNNKNIASINCCAQESDIINNKFNENGGTNYYIRFSMSGAADVIGNVFPKSSTSKTAYSAVNKSNVTINYYNNINRNALLTYEEDGSKIELLSVSSIDFPGVNYGNTTTFDKIKDNKAIAVSGHTFINDEKGEFYYFDGKTWRRGDGFKLYERRGTSGERPNNLSYEDRGFQFFDTTLGMPVWWNGSSWVEGDNQAAGIQRAGTWSQRPNADGSYLENGFQYFLLESEPDEAPDGNPMESITGNGKPIWWIQDGRKWVDATGATVTG